MTNLTEIEPNSAFVKVGDLGDAEVTLNIVPPSLIALKLNKEFLRSPNFIFSFLSEVIILYLKRFSSIMQFNLCF